MLLNRPIPALHWGVKHNSSSLRLQTPTTPTRPIHVALTGHANPTYHDDIDVLYTQSQIRNRVQALGRLIATDYSDLSPLVLGVLTGAFVFTSDLVREMEPPPRGLTVDFIRASSYGSGQVSSGKVQVTKTNKSTVDVTGRHVLLVEDILDTGRTLVELVQHIREEGAASVKVAVLLDKKERRIVPMTPDYSCFEVSNQFVVGYGLDYDEEYRTLPYIGILKQHVYKKPDSEN